MPISDPAAVATPLNSCRASSAVFMTFLTLLSNFERQDSSDNDCARLDKNPISKIERHFVAQCVSAG
jgi:hypothetical protein